jgi:hypothetical protein
MGHVGGEAIKGSFPFTSGTQKGCLVPSKLALRNSFFITNGIANL